MGTAVEDHTAAIKTEVCEYLEGKIAKLKELQVLAREVKDIKGIAATDTLIPDMELYASVLKGEASFDDLT